MFKLAPNLNGTKHGSGSLERIALRLKSLRLANWQWTALGFALILGFWQTYGLFSNPFLFPPVTRVLGELWIYISSGVLLQALLQTLLLLATGLLIGTVVGIVIGLGLGVNRVASDIFAPFLQAAYATPRIALIPLIIIWFGVEFRAQVVLVFLSCVFEVIGATEAGVREVSDQYFEVAKSFRLPMSQTFAKVIVPGAFSYILSGIRLGLGHAFIGAIGAELFMQSTGLGAIVLVAMQEFRTDQVLANILVLAAIASLLVVTMRSIERRAQPWRTETFE